MVDSFFADTSEFQVPVDDSYPYRIYSFRSNDGTYEDHNFEANYRWAAAAADVGRLDCFIVYFYWRANWHDTAQTHINMVQSMGGPHPKMVSMIDLESGGNPGGDQSDGVNRAYWMLTGWLGTTGDIGTRRVIGYANRPDFDSMWPTRPDGLAMVGAGYGDNPNLPGQIAHQYTDGQGYGGGLPEGAPPFGNCDMNSADGLSPIEFAAKCGITTTSPGGEMQLTDVMKDKYGNDVTVGDLLAWISLHCDITADAVGGVGTRSQLPPGLRNTGHPCLGGHDIVGALATIGAKLGIAGFDPAKAE